MTEQRPVPEKYERRHGPDWLCRAFSYLALIAWILFLGSLLVTHFAKPEMDTGLVRYWNIEIRADWHPQLTYYLQYMLWGALIISGISLLMNRMRLKRRSDHLHFNILLLLLSSAALLLYVYRQTL